MQAIFPFASVTAMSELWGKLQKVCMSDQCEYCSDQMVNTAKCLAVHYESFSVADWEYIRTTLVLISGWGESKHNKILLHDSSYICLIDHQFY